MRFTYDDGDGQTSLSRFDDQLRTEDKSRPPRPALVALLSLGRPERVLSYQRPVTDSRPSGGWEVYALYPDGVGVIEASAGMPRWVLNNVPTPRTASVSASWVPFSQVQSVKIVEAYDTLMDRPSELTPFEVVGDVVWTVQLASGASLVLDRARDGGWGHEAEEDFIRELQRRIASS